MSDNQAKMINMQSVARELVNQEVFANVGTMVEYILTKSSEGDSEAPFSWDDVNTSVDPSDWEVDQLHEYITDTLGDTWEDATGEPWIKAMHPYDTTMVRDHIEVEYEIAPEVVATWDAEKLHAFIVEKGDEWETITGDPYTESAEEADERHDDEADSAREYIRSHAEPIEVFEWWAVSNWLKYKLEERGEIIFDAGDFYVWGRATTGQAILMDSVIQDIAQARYKAMHGDE